MLPLGGGGGAEDVFASPVGSDESSPRMRNCCTNNQPVCPLNSTRTQSEAALRAVAVSVVPAGITVTISYCVPGPLRKRRSLSVMTVTVACAVATPVPIRAIIQSSAAHPPAPSALRGFIVELLSAVGMIPRFPLFVIEPAMSGQQRVAVALAFPHIFAGRVRAQVVATFSLSERPGRLTFSP